MSMMLISPWSRPLRNGKENPKNYPYWEELVALLKEHTNFHITQIGVGDEKRIKGIDKYMFDMSLENVWNVTKDMDVWIAVDNFLQHMCAYHNKPGIVIFGPSDPELFGYKQNTNLLKDRKYLREQQFWLWEQCDYNAEAFLSPEDVYESIKNFMMKAGKRI